MANAPDFWWQSPGWKARGLWPLSRIYGALAQKRLKTGQRHAVPVPVLCVGNFTVGGQGKTPTALALAQAAKAKGLIPGFLSRGYGGRVKKPTVVDPVKHRAGDVGDEPLLLAAHALTVVSRKRAQGAAELVARGANFIIMDDGFQSAQVHIDFALIVADSRRGLGNGKVLPAGPLRAPLVGQLPYASALLVVGGERGAEPLVRRMARAGKPVYRASIASRPNAGLLQKPLLAWAGIADPAKFFRSLDEMGATIASTRSFPDHHMLTDAEMADLLNDAARDSLQLATTAKDRARLEGAGGRARDLLNSSLVLDVDLVFESPKAPDQIIRATMEAANHRRFKARL